MPHSRRLCPPIGAGPRLELERKPIPWVCILLIAVALIVILTLWGRLPKKPWLPHEAPVAVFPSLFTS